VTAPLIAMLVGPPLPNHRRHRATRRELRDLVVVGLAAKFTGEDVFGSRRFRGNCSARITHPFSYLFVGAAAALPVRWLALAINQGRHGRQSPGARSAAAMTLRLFFGPPPASSSTAPESIR